jgi:hypothetical protein
MQGRIQDFKLEGALKKICGERREARKLLGYFVWKITTLRQKIIFFPIIGGGVARRVPPPPPGSAPEMYKAYYASEQKTSRLCVYSLIVREYLQISAENEIILKIHFQFLNYCNSIRRFRGSFKTTKYNTKRNAKMPHYNYMPSLKPRI